MAQDELVRSRSSGASTELSGVEDVNLVAYLVSRGFVAIPYMKEAKEGESQVPRVVWDVQGKNIEKVRREYYGNANVGVRDFVRSLREVRTDLNTMKNMANNGQQFNDLLAGID